MNKTINKLKDVEKKMAALRREQSRLEASNFHDELRPKVKEAIGKTFAYRRNCYSCPEKPSDYWDVFRKLVAVEFSEYHAYLIFQEVCVDSYGAPEITLKSDLLSSRDDFPKLSTGWAACEASEFEDAFAAAMEQFNSHKLFSERTRC